ncbi:trace amine-associated receptor 13c-like [Xenentodon cancila]
MSFISLNTVVLNLLVIISVSHFRQLHTPTNILLLSLAVADFLVGLLVMPLEIHRSTSCWFLGDNICVLYIYILCHIAPVSVGNIILISVDRYVAICHPLHYSTRITLARTKTLVCLCWLWYGVYSIFFVKDELIQPGRSNSCIGECTLIINFFTGTVDLILSFIIPVTVIVVLYMRVFVVAVSQAPPPPKTNREALTELYQGISEQQTAHPEAFHILAGEFNHTDPKTIFPNLHHHRKFPTHRDNILDQVYTTSKATFIITDWSMF